MRCTATGYPRRRLRPRGMSRRLRAGRVLPIVLGGMTLLVLLSAAITDRALHGFRSASRALDGARLRALTEAAMANAVASWNQGAGSTLAIGGRDTLHQTTGTTGTVVVTRVRTRANEYLMDARATNVRLHAPGQDAMLRVVRPIRVQWAPVPVPAVFTLSGSVVLEGRAAISGVDSVSDGWSGECVGDTRTASIAAVAARSLSVAQNVTLAGAPLLISLSSSQATQFTAAFDESFQELSAIATAVRTDSVLTLAGANFGTAPCTALLGDASRATTPSACQRYWPVVRLTPPSEVRLTGSTPSQGVLLVDGDLKIDAGVRVNGTVMVTGRVTAVLASNAVEPRITGVLLVRDRNSRGSRLSGGVRVRANQCAVRRSLAAAGTPLLSRPAAWWEP